VALTVECLAGETMHWIKLMEAIMSPWLLEIDNNNEIYTQSRVDEATIEESLNFLGGTATFYCCLANTLDETRLWCVGEPDRRLVEGRWFEDETIFHFVLRKTAGERGGSTTIRHGIQANERVTVESAEVLSAAEAIAVFRSFFRSRRIPDEFELVPKAYVFGALSFKD
jgi:hypothetical protein